MNANFTKQIIEMSTTEAKAAGKFGSPEFNELQGLRAAFPAFQIVVKAPKKAKNQLKIDYKFMEKYIKEHDDEDKTMLKEFYSLRGLDENGKKKQFAQAVPYGILKQWFLTYYPEVAKMNDTVAEILKKAQANSEAAKKAA